MTKRRIDYSLYLVTDRGLSRGRPTLEIVRAAVRGGATCVQLREKACSTRTFIEEAVRLKALLEPIGVPLIINDRVDIALAMGADGVHLGQDDMPLARARDLAGDHLTIGISVASVQEAAAAQSGGADYLGISPIFATPTKTDTPAPLGLAGLQEIRRAVHIPLVAIGGLNRGNAAEVIRSGADGIAVVSAITAAEDPEEAARDLKTQIDVARARWD